MGKIILRWIIILLAIAAFAAIGPLRHKFLADSEKILGSVAAGVKKDTAQPADKTIALYCKDGSVMVGRLISKTEDEYVIEWKGEETVVFANNVERVGSPKEALETKRVLSDEEISKFWPFNNDVVVRLTNRSILDAKITRVAKDKVSLVYSIDGGTAEQEIERSKIEYLIFKPVENTQSKSVEVTLKRLFPKMQSYKMGNITIYTDCDILWRDDCKEALNGVYTDIYFSFFPLLKDRRPQMQNFVVIFDDFIDFVEYAATDGVPGWAIAGYFDPEEHVLYLFNVLGKRFSEVLFEALVGESGRAIDDFVEDVESQVDSRYHIFIEGQIKAIRDKFWEAYAYFKDLYREATISTLRHEFAHEVLANWGLQNIRLSKMEENGKSREELIKRKEEFLKTKDYKKKASVIRSIARLKSAEEPIEAKAANSWLAEGIATYFETRPPGSKEDIWLYFYQDMAKNNSVYPFEAFAAYRMGSFPGVSSQAVYYLYAQSWAYVNFLMAKYPEEFMAYQERMAEGNATGQEDVAWLLKATGKDLRALDAEFAEYMSQFEPVEDPSIKEFEKLYYMFND